MQVDIASITFSFGNMDSDTEAAETVSIVPSGEAAKLVSCLRLFAAAVAQAALPFLDAEYIFRLKGGWASIACQRYMMLKQDSASVAMRRICQDLAWERSHLPGSRLGTAKQQK